MVGTVFFQSKEGMNFLEFKQKYADKVKGKHGIYVIQTNLEQDQEKVGRRTRNKNYSGSVVKVGRSQGTFMKRFSDYAYNTGAQRFSRTDQGGLKILYVKFLPQKNPLATGKSLTEIFERQLLNYLKEKYGLVEHRGVERFKIDIDSLFDIINNFKIDQKENEEEFIRRSERLGGERLMWLSFDPYDKSKTYLNFHDNFNELIQKFKSQIQNKFSKITEGFLPNKENEKLNIVTQMYTQYAGALSIDTDSQRGDNNNNNDINDDIDTSVGNYKEYDRPYDSENEESEGSVNRDSYYQLRLGELNLQMSP